jgi:hypothetical protein
VIILKTCLTMALSCQVPIVPYIFSFSLFMILAGLTLPRSSGASEIIDVHRSAHYIHSSLVLEYSLIYYYALWCTLAVLSTIFMFIPSLNYYAAWPRILPLTETIHYSNPGFRSDHHATGPGVDTRPLVLRAVGPHEVVIILKKCLIMAFITSGSLYFELCPDYDTRWPHFTSFIWCV